jgi:hypothetical protein
MSEHYNLYVFNIGDPLGGITVLGNVNIAADVVDISVVGPFAFLATSDPNAGFSVWDVREPSVLAQISSFNYSQKTVGIDYEDNLVYTANESNDALRIIYSP